MKERTGARAPDGADGAGVGGERPKPVALLEADAAPARRRWWRAAALRRAARSDGERSARVGVPRSTGIVELHDVARKVPAAALPAQPEGARIACDASAGAESAGEPTVADGVRAEGGRVARQRRLRWVGWISRRVIHDPAAL